MRFVVIGLNKRRLSGAVAAMALVFTVIISMAVGILINIFGEELFISAASGGGEQIFIIDAGHGGEDGGAVGVNGVEEKELNLIIAKEIGDCLEKAGYTVVYTRTDDRMLYSPEENIKGMRKLSDLKNRLKVAERYPEAVFISIHMNSFGSSKYSGLQVYYSENDPAGRGLAQSVQDRVREDLQPANNRKIKAGRDMYILEHISNPAILIECGFLTNAAECEKLSEKEYQKQLSFAIVCGIIEYIDNKT